MHDTLSCNQLIIELAAAAIYRLKQILGLMTDAEFRRSDCYWHIYVSSFETGCWALWRLGLAHGGVTETARTVS